MKRLFALYALIITVAAGSAYASISSTYNYCARKNVPGYWNGWYFFNGNDVSAMFQFNGPQQAVIAWVSQGHYLTEASIWKWLRDNGNGQQWIEYRHQANGFRDFQTKDGSLFAKVYWLNGMHSIRIATPPWTTAHGLWEVPTPPVQRHSKPKKAQPKRSQPKELLPPVEDTI